MQKMVVSLTVTYNRLDKLKQNVEHLLQQTKRLERIYIVDKDDERYCHIFIKGCSGEDYTGFFQTAGYIEQKTIPVCDSEQYCICP